MSNSYVESLEEQYWRDPASIDQGWRHVFDVLRDLDASRPRQSTPPLYALVRWFREAGHRHAQLNPLSPPNPDLASDRLRAVIEAELDATGNGMASYGTDDAAYDLLRRCYAGGLGVETAHIEDVELARWLFQRLEESVSPDPDALKRALRLVIAAEEFEAFMSVKFPAKKRFGIEGGEAVLPVLDRVILEAMQAGVTDILIGTMHRGRLNLLGNVLGKDLRQLLAEFKGLHPFASDMKLPADVPYHLGLDHELERDGLPLRMTVCANPSHLEAVNPVLLGRVRARQDRLQGSRHVLPILLHTDASVVGQGVVAECVQMAGLAGFNVGGTLHIVINNQIGFTTEPEDARTSRYCTGAWKAIDSLILHVNGDNLQAGLRSAQLAVAFRQAHGRDAVIDINCYRRNGHNEIDEPRFTQPLMYRSIDEHPSLAELASAELLANGLLAQEEVDTMRKEARAALHGALEQAAHHRPNLQSPDPPASDGRGAVSRTSGIDADRIQELLGGLSRVPAGFNLEPKVERILRQRALAGESGIGWPLAEALGLASLLVEGIGVRFTGQDIIRGAFSHRHLIVSDMETGERYLSLNHLTEEQASLEVVNSPLSEYSVLGFEYGYSLECPDRLVLWEAQFGDFANGAQIILDQFIFSGRAKWGQRSAIAVLLPHGLEGQGPEHSSARPERLLQMAAGDNVEIAHPSTPANYFHLLRRQALRTDPVPLIILAPKSLLRLPAAVSRLEEFTADACFRGVIAPNGPKAHLILCSGKIAYELEQAITQSQASDVGIIRLEMLYPLPTAELVDLLHRLRPARLTWLQEEPINMGAWAYLDRRLEKVVADAGLPGVAVRCIARPESSSPAGSFHMRHEADQKDLIARALAPGDHIESVSR